MTTVLVAAVVGIFGWMLADIRRNRKYIKQHEEEWEQESRARHQLMGYRRLRGWTK